MEELLEALSDKELSSSAIGFLCSHSEELGLKLPLEELNKAFQGSKELVPCTVRGRTTQEVLLDCGGAAADSSRPRKLFAMHYMQLLKHLSLEQLQILAAKVEARMMQRTPSLMVPPATSKLPVNRALSRLQRAMAAAATKAATAAAAAAESAGGEAKAAPLLGADPCSPLDTLLALGSPLASITNFDTDTVWTAGSSGHSSECRPPEGGVLTCSPTATLHLVRSAPAFIMVEAAAAPVAAAIPNQAYRGGLFLSSEHGGEPQLASPFQTGFGSAFGAGAGCGYPAGEGCGTAHGVGACLVTAPSGWDFSCIGRARSGALDAWPTVQSSPEVQAAAEHSTTPASKPACAAPAAAAHQLPPLVPRPSSAPSPTNSVGSSSSSTIRSSSSSTIRSTGSVGSARGRRGCNTGAGSREAARKEFHRAAELLAAAVPHFEAGLVELQGAGASGGKSLAAVSALCHLSAALKLQEGLAAFLATLQ